MMRLKYILLVILMAIGVGFTGVVATTTTSTAARHAYADSTKCVDGSDLPTDGSGCDPSLVSTDKSTCDGGGFFGLPKWYKYLSGQHYVDQVTQKPQCIPQLDGINSIWHIVAAVIELLIRLAALVAITFVVYGGITYTISQGNPDKTKQSLKTIINALIGLTITIIATAVVSYIAGRFS